MSRWYEMSVTIAEYDPKRRAEIEYAAAEERPEFTDWTAISIPLDNPAPTLSCAGQGSLCGGETGDQFARRLTVAIFKANRGRCKVEVRTTCLENLPYESHTPGDDIEDSEFLDAEEV